MTDQINQVSDANESPQKPAINDSDIEEKKELLEILGTDITKIKDIIDKNVEADARAEVLHCLGFFINFNPNIAEKLLEFLEKGDIKGFIKLSYENIYVDLNKIGDKLPAGKGKKNNLGKDDIKNLIDHIKYKQNLIESDLEERLDVPTVHTGLLKSDWIRY